jgi:hypothetical protein
MLFGLRLVLLAGEQVDGDLVDRNFVLGDEKPDRPAGHRYRVHIELHGTSSLR